jgi:hypothetical protein
MLKLYKGDLLLFTNKGFKHASEITNNDLILTLNQNGTFVFDEIDEIVKIYKKKYKLNKIDGYFLNDNIELLSLKNIPLNTELNEIGKYLDDYYKNCASYTKIGELSTFDYYGFPVASNETLKTDIDDLSLSKEMRFMGLLMTNMNDLDVNKHKETIEFVTNYLTENKIDFSILENENKNLINFKIDISKLNIMTLNLLFSLNKKNLTDFYHGLVEVNRDIIIPQTDKSSFLIIKYTCLLLGMSISAIFKENKIIIKIPKKITNMYYNYFNYNKIVWTKIRSIKKVPNYNGNLYFIKTKSGNPYLSDIGIIS